MATLKQDRPSSEELGENQGQQVVNNITVSNSAVVVGSSHTDIVNTSPTASDGQGGEMEKDLVRVFRGFNMRNRVKFMQSAYDFEDSCNEEARENKNK